MGEKLYSVEEAAKELGGVSKWTIHAWLSQGRLRRTKVGARTMISQRAIERFLDDCNRVDAHVRGGNDVPDAR